MARVAYTIRNFGWTVLAIIALWFLSLLLFVIVQCSRGVIATDDLVSMLFVLQGDQRYVVPNDDYRRYQKYLAEEEKYLKDLETRKGAPVTQHTAAEAAEKRRRIQEENAATLRDQLDKQRRDLETLRVRIEKEKKDLEDTQKAIKAAEEKRAVQALAEERKKLEKVLGAMDTAQLGEYFSDILRREPRDGPVEAARIMHAYMKGDFIAEVMEEMPAEDRQKILPVLEYKYADWPAEKIAQEWMHEKRRPAEMVAFMQQMPARKAFMILPHLDPTTKVKVVQLLQTQER